jgi:DNA repair exonuclease SbcCD ATPase subunit
MGGLMANDLRFEISLGIDQAQKSAVLLTKTTAGIQKQIESISKSGFKMGDNLAAGLQKAQAVAPNFAENVGKAGYALQGMNYILQDSPYFLMNFRMGVMAIGNNISPVVESISRLTQSTGGLRGAMSAMGAALMGPQGIVLGIGALVSVVQAATFYLDNKRRKMEELKKETQGTTMSIEDLVKELEKIKTVDIGTEEVKKASAIVLEQWKADLTALESEIENTVPRIKKKQDDLTAERKRNAEAAQRQNQAIGISYEQMSGQIEGSYNRVNVASSRVNTDALKKLQDQKADLAKKIADLSAEMEKWGKKSEDYTAAIEGLATASGQGENAIRSFIAANQLNEKQIQLTIKEMQAKAGLLAVTSDEYKKLTANILLLQQVTKAGTGAPDETAALKLAASLRLALIQDGEKKEIAEAQAWYEEKKQVAGTNQAAMQLLEKVHQMKLQEITAKYETERQDANIAAWEKAFAAKERQQKAEESLNIAQAIQAGATENEISIIQRSQLQARIIELNQYVNASTNLSKEEKEARKLQIIQLRAELAGIEKQITDDNARESQQRILNAQNAVRQMISSFAQIAGTLYAMNADANRKELADEGAKLKEKLENDRKAALSHAYTREAQQRVNDEYDNKEKALEDEMSKRAEESAQEGFALKKAGDIANALMSTYVAAAKALELGPIAGPIAAAGITAAGMVNVGYIRSQEPPKLAEGDVNIMHGPGTDTSDNIVAMISPGESVISARRTREYEAELRQINAGTFQRNEAELRQINAGTFQRNDAELTAVLRQLSAKISRLEDITARIPDYHSKAVTMQGTRRIRHSAL